MKKILVQESNDKLHEKLIGNCNEARRLVEDFLLKMNELQEKSISEYGSLIIQIYTPVEVEWRKATETFIDSETNTKMFRYYLSDVKIAPLTLVHNGRLKI